MLPFPIAALAWSCLGGCHTLQAGRYALLGAGLALYRGYMMALAPDWAGIAMAALLLAGPARLWPSPYWRARRRCRGQPGCSLPVGLAWPATFCFRTDGKEHHAGRL